MKDTLLNGDHENYNMDYGYTLHMINDAYSEGITGEIKNTARALNTYKLCILISVFLIGSFMILFGIRFLIFKLSII